MSAPALCPVVGCQKHALGPGFCAAHAYKETIAVGEMHANAKRLHARVAELERELSALRETSAVNEAKLRAAYRDERASAEHFRKAFENERETSRRRCEERDAALRAATPAQSSGAVSEIEGGVIVDQLVTVDMHGGEGHPTLYVGKERIADLAECPKSCAAAAVALARAMRANMYLPHADAGGAARPMAYDCDGCDGAALHHYCIRCLDAKSDAAAEAARREVEIAAFVEAADMCRPSQYADNARTLEFVEGRLRAHARRLELAHDARAAEREKTETSGSRPAAVPTAGPSAGDGADKVPEKHTDGGSREQTGTSSEGATPAPCPRCKGRKGRFVNEWAVDERWVQCPDCHGTGRAPASSLAQHDDGANRPLMPPGTTTWIGETRPSADAVKPAGMVAPASSPAPAAPEARGEEPCGPLRNNSETTELGERLARALAMCIDDWNADDDDERSPLEWAHHAVVRHVQPVIDTERARARDAALEEAEKVAEEWGPANLGPDKTIARRIRSLRGTTEETT